MFFSFPPMRFPLLLPVALTTPVFAVVNIDYVTVGNSGNAADPATGSLYGAVAYEYKIARNETTLSQYAEFLNATAATDADQCTHHRVARRVFQQSNAERSARCDAQ